MPLQAVMARVGAEMPAGEFVRVVVEVFQEVWYKPEAAMRSRFRQSRSYRDFVGLLAAVPLAQRARVLAVGCGAGFGGRGPGFVADVVEARLRERPNVTVHRMEITPWILESPAAETGASGRYSLVVTHSTLRYIFDYRPLCRLLDSLVEPGGRYLMANEPNARFWNNTVCRDALRLKESAERHRKDLARLTDPQRYWNKALRWLHLERETSPFARMNQILRGRLGLRGDLTPAEIQHINEPHMPEGSPESFRLGSNGVDWERMQEIFPALRLELVRTSGYVARDNPHRLFGEWKVADRALALRYPLDGCSVGALWRKPDE